MVQISDYNPIVTSEMFVRNLTSPPLDYDDVSKAEMLAKIEAIEIWAKYKYFGGDTPISDAKAPIALVVLAGLLSNPSLASKHYTLASESIGDYSYSLGGSALSPNKPKSWVSIAEETLSRMATDSGFSIRKVNE